MTGAISGRATELHELQSFLARILDGAHAFVLEGDAGMGKTTLWRAAVAEAESLGYRVLQAVPAESESTLSFSSIGDLLDPVLEVALDSLPDVQRRALVRALVLGDEDGPAPDAHAIGVAVLTAIRGLAQSGSVLVAIDDVHWLDSASAGALAYAMRRLRDERVGTLVAKRSGMDSSVVEELRRAPGASFDHLEVGPLDVNALHEAIEAQLGLTIPRPLLAEVHEAAGGNPFYALEIVRSLRRTGARVEAGRPLPIPKALRELVAGRVAELSVESRAALLAAAALSQPTVSQVISATELTFESALGPALAAGIVELNDDRIRFTHPLLAASAYESADAVSRARMHRRLAELVDDPEARGRHLAAAVTEPDADVARALDEAAVTALARGAPRSAALLLERAGTLTPTGHQADERRRLLQAATAHHEAGDTERARALLEPELETSEPDERAELLVVLARVKSLDDDLREASALYEQAVSEAESGSRVETIAQEGLGSTLFRLRERLADAAALSATAATNARSRGDVQLEAESLGTKALTEAALGRAEAVGSCDAALSLQAACADRTVLRQPRFAVTVVRFWHDDLAGAERAWTEMSDVAVERGDESSIPYLVVMLAQVDCARGRFVDAVARTEVGEALAAQAGQRTLLGYVLAVRAVAEAHLGRAEDAMSSAARAFELAGRTGAVPIFASWALGHLALSRGDPVAALDHLGPLLEHHEREAIREPGALPFAPDAIEAFVNAGRLDEAERTLDVFEEASRRLERKRGLASARRCRGLLHSSQGKLGDALGELEAAVELASAGETPFEHARALMALGAALRRAKRRREARATLEQAIALFEKTGAAIWAERAREELRRVSGRATSPGALTPAEQRVASLVAEGKTNREVAAALYLSERTVEGHLSRVFGKLGVRSRTELVHALARSEEVVAPSNTGDSPVSGVPSAP